MKYNEAPIEKKYVAPDCEAIEFEIEQNILQASGQGNSNSLQDFGAEDW